VVVVTELTASEHRRAARPEERSERGSEASVTELTASEHRRAARPEERSERGSDTSVTEPVLDVQDVRLSFAGVKAIDGVSFTVGQSELFAIIGPNGAGKTSIFNVLSGVYRPQAGTVVFDGEDITGNRPHAIAAAGMARTFQNVELFANLTVLDNLMLGRHTHLRYGTLSAIAWWGRARRAELEARAAVEDIIDFLELEAWRRLPVGLVPFGVQKRVELGRALAMKPKLLLLDEPVGGMNLEETEDMARYILDIRDELDIPIILVEHDMGLVMDLADRVMVVDFGVAIATGPPSEIQHNPDVIRAYLGEVQQV
jgi:branched-chain amino acid transport system ATP-binding protein